MLLVGSMSGRDRVKLQAQRHNLGPVDIRQRHHRCVPAPLQLKRQGDQRIDVAKGADVRENDAQWIFLNAS